MYSAILMSARCQSTRPGGEVRAVTHQVVLEASWRTSKTAGEEVAQPGVVEMPAAD